MNERVVDFKEDISWTQGYELPDAEHFGIWQRRSRGHKPLLYFIIDWEKKTCIGPFEKRRIFRAYVIANGWMEIGCSKGPANFGFYGHFDSQKLAEANTQEYERVDPSTLSPLLTVYSWSKEPAMNPAVAYDQSPVRSLYADALNSLLRQYQLPWTAADLAVGALSQGRNFHTKGTTVLSRSQKPGDFYAIVDWLENYPGPGL